MTTLAEVAGRTVVLVIVAMPLLIPALCVWCAYWATRPVV